MYIKPVLQKTDSDCGLACCIMILDYYQKPYKKTHHIHLSNELDGLQVRTIESFFRERNFRVISGNMHISFLRYFIKIKIPIICLISGHYVLVTGFSGRKIRYNCPIKGETTESIIAFNRIWWNNADGTYLLNWAIAVY